MCSKCGLLHYEEPLRTVEILKQVIWKNSYKRTNDAPVYYDNSIENQIIQVWDPTDENGELADKNI